MLTVAIWWLSAHGVAHGFFGSQSTDDMLAQSPAPILAGDQKEATQTAQSRSGNSITSGNASGKVTRTPTVIGDVFEAFGKPADVEVCGFGVQHVEEYPMGISLPPVTAANATLNAAVRDLASSKNDADRALGLYLQAKLAGDAARERMQIQQPGCGRAPV